jgi:hypothetical protein
MTTGRYIRIALLQAAVLLVIVGCFNIVVDPYWRWGHAVAGVTDRKPKAGDLDWTKLYQVERLQPRTVLFGSSRVEAGFDPESTLYSSEMRPLFNFGRPGTGLEDAFICLRHSVDVAPVATAFIGIDFVNFLTFERPARGATVAVADPTAESPAASVRFLENGEPNPRRMLGLAWEFVTTTLSLKATAASAATVIAGGDSAAPTRTRWGFNPFIDGQAAARLEGYRALFDAKNSELVRRYAATPIRLDPVDSEVASSFATLRRLLAFTRDHNIRTVLFTHPYHADFLEILAASGLDAMQEEWLRQVMAQIEAVNPRAELWDFRGHHAIAAEPVPPRSGKTGGEMRWYWEPAHYKAAVGERMMAQMLRQGPPDHWFGVRLEPGTVESQLAHLRRQAADYRAAASERVAAITAQVDAARRKRL